MTQAGPVAPTGPVAPKGLALAATRRAVLRLAPTLRDLPWRHTRDPWAILVSEVMLQQTQALRVVTPWVAFLARFPTPADCARARPGQVLASWAGLGYNRRALNLQRTARAVVDDHAGRLPADLDLLLRLPGVGPYTARAVLAFAFEADAAVVDTNVARVLARAVAGRTLRPAEAQALADRLLPPGRSWIWNQTLMELGATRCTARAPRCFGCPLAARCTWAAAGHPSPDPWVPARPQAAFAGSDRQGRGRLVDALRSGPVAAPAVAATAGWPDDPARARRVAADLLAEGLVRRDSAGTLQLP